MVNCFYPIQVKWFSTRFKSPTFLLHKLRIQIYNSAAFNATTEAILRYTENSGIKIL